MNTRDYVFYPWTRLAATILVLVGLAACQSGETPMPDSPTPPPSHLGDPGAGAGGGRPLLEPEPTPGVRFRLGNADASSPDGLPSVRNVTGEPLDDEALAALLARLPDLPETAADARPSALREGPRPPAIAGDTLRVAFPPPAAPASAAPDADASAPSVLRVQPEGEVGLASHLAVTFSAPMVPLAALSEIDEENVPVTLSPEPPGRWRWVGSRTLLYEPETRFPMATDFSAVVADGAKTADGRVLAAGRSWTFRTPPPRVIQVSGQHAPITREPVIVLAFDQQIDPTAAIAAIQATADGVVVPLRLATSEELDADTEADLAVRRAQDGRWLALRPESTLPLGAKLVLRVGPGLPSAEGPLVSEEEQTFEFEVYRALQVSEIDCDKEKYDDPVTLRAGADDARTRGCLPFAGLRIRFNNPLRPESFDASSIQVEPPVPGLQTDINGSSIVLRGATAGQTRYVVTLPPEIGDVFGQTLGRTMRLTFETGDAPPALFSPGDDMIVLDPEGPRAMTVSSINNKALDVRIYQVEPGDWPAYLRFSRSYFNERTADREPPPGREVSQERVAPEGDRDAIARVPISLDEALNDEGHGHAVVVVEVAGWAADESYLNRPVVRWVQSTRLAVDAFADGREILAWVTDLRDGTSVDGATIRVLDGANALVEGSSGSDGLARLATLPVSQQRALERSEAIMVAGAGADSAFLRVDPWFLSEREPTNSLRWHVFDDRGLYRPGETSTIHGYLRRYGTGPEGDLERLPDGLGDVDWTLMSANGEEVESGTWAIDEFGSFGGAISMPADITVGMAVLRLALPSGAGFEGDGYGHPLRVAEFRRPEFEVSVEAEQAEVVLGGTGVFEASASYFAGGALPGADVRWTVSGSPTNYSPPGWQDFTFGTWTPWWFDAWGGGGRGAERLAFASESGGFGDPFGRGSFESWEARTDASGAHRLSVEFAGIFPLSAARFEAEANVEDVNRQTISARDTLLAHPAEHYVGLRADGWFVEAGTEWSVDAVVADIEGNAVTGSVIEMRAERLAGRWEGDTWREEAIPAGACGEVSDEGPIRCSFSFTDGGRYRVSASIIDDGGRPNRSELTVWVPGGPAAPGDARIEQQQVELIPEAEDYEPGDTARVLLRAPFAPAEALVTWRRDGLLETERIRLSEPSTILEVPIEDAHVPGLTLAVDLVGRAPRDLPGGADTTDDASSGSIAGRPAFAHGELRLSVPPRSRTLRVAAAPSSSSLRPGSSVSVTLTVSDATGAALPNAQIALIVVDESVLSLTGHRIESPIDSFYGERGPGVEDRLFRYPVQLADPATLMAALGDEMVVSEAFGLDMAESGTVMNEMAAMDAEGDAAAPMMRSAAQAAYGGGGDDGADAGAVVSERVDLNPLAAFVPDLVTGEDGTVTATIDLPDNVTRYRITAVATDGGRRFGLAEAGIVAELPLVVRPSAPRFLNFGDSFELPIVVQSRAEEDRTVDVIVRTANLTLTESAGYRITVPAGDRVELRVPAATILPGTAAFQAAAFDTEDPSRADLQRVTLPVWTPATNEAFATYGTLDEGATLQPVRAPEDVVPGFGGLEITTSSTALAELSDAFLYLNSYPFEGAEQLASRLLANVALRDAVAAFGGEDVPTEAEVDAAIDADIERLIGLQQRDGGWSFWSRNQDTHPWATLHATHALVRAGLKGYGVESSSLTIALDYLRSIEDHIRRQRSPWPPEARRTAEAQALYVRAVASADDVDAARATTLFDEAEDDEPIEVLGWLLGTIARAPVLERDGEAARDDILRRLNNRVTETASTAQFATSYSEEAGALILAGDRRADAVVLDALIAVQPENDLVPKLVRGLLDGRRAGRWGSTQDNAWVLLAMDAYFRTFEGVAPDFVARAWLGDRFAGEAPFAGRSPDRQRIDVPLDELPSGETDLVVSKEGEGRLYYRLGLRYAPADLSLPPEERGFSVERSYAAIDDSGDVRRTVDGTWEIKAGARVRVRLTLVAPARRYHVALVDPLPAGLEALNPDLTTSEQAPPGMTDEEIELENEDGSPMSELERVSSMSTWWNGRWYNHEGFRDDRVEIFADRLEGGVWRYDYVARATTPGVFNVPPTKAEELYHPETFGRTATELVRIMAGE